MYRFGESQIKNLLNLYSKKPFVFLETARFDRENKKSFLFSNFVDIVTFYSGSDVEKFFARIEDFLKKGFWLAGYFCYEFGYFLESALSNLRQNYSYPLVWLGVCKNPIIFNHTYKNFFGKQLELHCDVTKINPNITKLQYLDAINKIKYFLEEGLTYQVNYTFKIKFDFKGSPIDLYLALRKAQPTSYMAFINTTTANILSFSPELFFRIGSNYIKTSPMKGTIQKGFGWLDDLIKRKHLRNDKKIKAENVMIVDLLRNDLGKICKKVYVEKLFTAESYRTINQLTSTICGKLKDNLKIYDIFSSLFPCGSITGAPKIKTMQIIAQLEKEARKIYTGAIGYISPKRQCCFNVAIRTILLEERDKELGVGGGIVYDSSAKDEFEEAILKAKFFILGLPNFYLIESILWDKEFVFLELHLDRLKKSCKYFSICLDFKRLKDELKVLDKELKNLAKIETKKFKVRILISLEGSVKIEKELLEELKVPLKVKLSTKKLDPQDIFLYHKTTQRKIYDEELSKAKKEGFFDVIFLNTKGQITEGAITNIFVKKDNFLYTPPIKCGLLPGVLREYFLKNGIAKEKILYLEDIKTADKLYVGNSVRGLLEAEVFVENFLESKTYEKAAIY
ncbi:MAG: bifunctional anthranilate synthase component I family protein/class IV aminotransferase [Candidatus Omnitrophica bacterium]|nr:bifunctional anthranilate synthase component I family protein/class IV aminotransferase [Candidatus Omnitrophota bacterium]